MRPRREDGVTSETFNIQRKITRYLRRIGQLSMYRASTIFVRDGLNRKRDRATIWHCVDVEWLNDIARLRRRGKLAEARNMMNRYRIARRGASR